MDDVLATLLLGAGAGLGAAVVMAFPMQHQTEGFTPAYVAAAVVRRTDPGSVSFRDATVVHHVAGTLAGVLHGLVYLAVNRVVDGPTVAGASVAAHAAAVAVVVGFIYLVFAQVVLPRRGGDLVGERTTAVTGQWLRSALVYGAGVALLFPALMTVA